MDKHSLFVIFEVLKIFVVNIGFWLVIVGHPQLFWIGLHKLYS